MPQIYANKSLTTNKINQRDYSLNEKETCINELSGKTFIFAALISKYMTNQLLIHG